MKNKAIRANNERDTKCALLNECQKIVAQKIAEAKRSIEELKEASDLETKSSAGDKYETGRAMIQLESDKYTSQLSEALKLQKLLDQIPVDKDYREADLGCVVHANNGTFFLALPLGKITLLDKEFFLISLASPIGRELKGRKAGDSFMFNGRRIDVLEVY